VTPEIEARTRIDRIEANIRKISDRIGVLMSKRALMEEKLAYAQRELQSLLKIAAKKNGNS
jgi:DNA anti-recombination protein RmuC